MELASLEHQTIQLLAYELWQQRGCPFGDPEADWFRAEEQVRRQNEDASQKPTIVAVAEAVGSVLGSVAGIVASVGAQVRPDETS